MVCLCCSYSSLQEEVKAESFTVKHSGHLASTYPHSSIHLLTINRLITIYELSIKGYLLENGSII